MSTLYRPILIESVEQAEALPVGTVALDLESDGTPGEVSKKQSDGRWSGIGDAGEPYAPRLMVGDYALVPVEAEEELAERSRLCQKDPDVLHRYVTGWQPYTAKEQNR